MSTKWGVLLTLSAVAALASLACAPVGGLGGGTLDNLGTADDLDGDGLPELQGPEGVGTGQMFGIRFINEITLEQAEAIVGQAIPGFLEVRVDIEVTLEYANGESITHQGSRPLGPFELAFETPCPENVVTNVALVATVPLIGDQTLLAQEINASETGAGGAVELVCDSVLEVRVFIDDAGSPRVETSLVAQ